MLAELLTCPGYGGVSVSKDNMTLVTASGEPAVHLYDLSEGVIRFKRKFHDPERLSYLGGVFVTSMNTLLAFDPIADTMFEYDMETGVFMRGHLNTNFCWGTDTIDANDKLVLIRDKECIVLDYESFETKQVMRIPGFFILTGKICPDGKHAIVTASSFKDDNFGDGTLSLMNLEDGSLVRHLATELPSPYDLAVLEDRSVAVLCRSQYIMLVHTDGTVDKLHTFRDDFLPLNMVYISCMRVLLVRNQSGAFQAIYVWHTSPRAAFVRSVCV